jgi:hypothetical protein
MNPKFGLRLRRLGLLPAAAVAILPAILVGAQPVAAAPGDVIADIIVPEVYVNGAYGIAKAVAYDGHNLYYAEFGGSTLHRIDMPPPGGPNQVTGHTDIPIIGAIGGIMTIAYDLGRDKFWAVSTDGTVIYLIDKMGLALRQFAIVQSTLPGTCRQLKCDAEVKIAYDRTDDTIWYSPDTTRRVYHFQTTGDLLSNAVPVAANPYFDVDVPPNDMNAYCPLGSWASGIATGGASIFIEVSGCNYYFEYSKTGTRLGATPKGFSTSGGLTCDNRTYPVSVIWMREGWNGHIYAIEQPRASACVYGGG